MTEKVFAIVFAILFTVLGLGAWVSGVWTWFLLARLILRSVDTSPTGLSGFAARQESSNRFILNTLSTENASLRRRATLSFFRTIGALALVGLLILAAKLWFPDIATRLIH